MASPAHISVALATLGHRDDEAKRAFATYLRDNQTPSERMMARVLCHLGIDAEPQVPVFGWIADFYDAKNRVVIEVDGSVHDDPRQRESDVVRDKVMREAGLTVIRVTNDEVRHFMANLVA